MGQLPRRQSGFVPAAGSVVIRPYDYVTAVVPASGAFGQTVGEYQHDVPGGEGQAHEGLYFLQGISDVRIGIFASWPGAYDRDQYLSREMQGFGLGCDVGVAEGQQIRGQFRLVSQH